MLPGSTFSTNPSFPPTFSFAPTRDGVADFSSQGRLRLFNTGTVLSGNDPIGIFGAPGSSLAGDAYTTFYIFNTSIGEIQSDPFFNSDLGGVVGIYAQPSPSLGAVLTINGISMGIGGGSVGYLYGVDYGDFSRSYDLAGDPSRSVYNQMSDPTRSIPVSINMPFTYTVTPANGGYGQGQVMLGMECRVDLTSFTKSFLLALGVACALMAALIVVAALFPVPGHFRVLVGLIS